MFAVRTPPVSRQRGRSRPICVLDMQFSRYVPRVNGAYGDGEIRTLDPLLARQVLSQLSYTPIWDNIFNLYYLTGLKWTRTTDLTLIRRAL